MYVFGIGSIEGQHVSWGLHVYLQITENGEIICTL